LAIPLIEGKTLPEVILSVTESTKDKTGYAIAVVPFLWFRPGDIIDGWRPNLCCIRVMLP